ncbi:MAG: ATP-binding protein [Clostridiales bacterium]|nr:ATP-binding protein [Clostridiales bacterium]
MDKKSDILTFRVSAGLKNLIGRDLISDKYIAVFELVKNSYDAGASKVNISYLLSDEGVGQIIISDNGCGMTYEDIIQKWLFVAYSEKKPQNRSKSSYRDEIKREVAGAKGVGRFSCDRLGASLQLITKTDKEIQTHVVDVNWNRFEMDDTKEFIEIPVDYSQTGQLPSGFEHGTTLIVNDLREAWDRDALLKLKRSLMKLISPDADKGELPFDIEMIAPSEQETDEKLLEEYWKDQEKKEDSKKKINPDRDIVNGKIKNDIFEKLNIKTTNIEVNVSEDGRSITSTLSDRGKYIFAVEEKNRKYGLLKNIHISVFYLNQSAKVNFTRQMGGVTPKNYGSVFIYKNGFRINPYGEPGQDFFGIDQRKAQGWKRFLGTREIMGRISIKGDNEQFVETTSRAHGFIQTPAVDMLADLFVEKVLKVLEKYVVNLINWGEPLKSNHNHTILPEEIGSEIVSQFITNINVDDIVSVNCNPDILTKNSFSKESDSITSSIRKLESVAEKTQDAGLMKLAQSVRKKTEAILSDNINLEEDNAAKEKELEQIRQESEMRKKQVYFLSGAANQNVTNLLGGFHTVYTLTDAIKGNINFLREELSKGKAASEELVLMVISEIYQANEKVHKLADLAIHGNQALRQEGENSIYDFIRQYIDEGLAVKGIEYILTPSDKAFDCKFDASSIGVILDNISSNAIKAGATKLHISLKEIQNYVEITFTDNGLGLDNDIDVDMLFEWGMSNNISKKGFGIGLYHVKQLLEEMRGTVAIDTTYRDGFRLVVKLKR